MGLNKYPCLPHVSIAIHRGPKTPPRSWKNWRYDTTILNWTLSILPLCGWFIYIYMWYHDIIYTYIYIYIFWIYSNRFGGTLSCPKPSCLCPCWWLNILNPPTTGRCPMRPAKWNGHDGQWIMAQVGKATIYIHILYTYIMLTYTHMHI